MLNKMLAEPAKETEKPEGEFPGCPRNPNTGWSETIEATPETEIKPSVGFSSNSFSYRHIGH